MSHEIDEYLKRCPELAALCSQNGWIDHIAKIASNHKALLK